MYLTKELWSWTNIYKALKYLNEKFYLYVIYSSFLHQIVFALFVF